MDRQNIEAFINCGVNKELTAEQLKKMALGLSGFYIIGIFYGLMLGGVERILGIAIIIVMLVFTIYIFLKTRNLSLKNRITIIGAISLEATINFLLFALILGQMLELDMWTNIVIVITPFISALLFYIIAKKLIIKGTYLNAKEARKNNIYLYSSLGGAAGILIARTFLKDVGQTAAISILIIGFLFLSSVFTSGWVNFLKLYYIKKLEKERNN